MYKENAHTDIHNRINILLTRKVCTVSIYATSNSSNIGIQIHATVRTFIHQSRPDKYTCTVYMVCTYVHMYFTIQDT